MATHGSLQVRELRRDVVTIISSTNKDLESPGSNSSTAQAANQVSMMAIRLAALHYPPRYQAAAQEMVTKTQSLAESLRSGDTGANSTSTPLIAAIMASQRFYRLLNIPSVCTTTSS